MEGVWVVNARSGIGRWLRKSWRRSAMILAVAIAVQCVAAAFPAGVSLAADAPSTTAPATGAEPKPDAKAAILIDAASGQVLFSMNADEALPPASMAKMMTEYLILESIAAGKLKWEDMVTISEFSSVISTNKQLSGIPKAKGDTYSVKDLFYAVTIYSDNGAAIALAEAISGTEENFTKMMNDTAVKLGLSKGAHFINTSGLDRVDLGKYAPASIPGETTFSASDAAMIAYHLLKDHKEILDFSKIVSKKFRPTDKEPMVNYNWMLEGNADNPNFKKFVYTGLDGLKTGHTDNAGYCFTGTAERNGVRYISVVMGAKTRDASFNETKKLLDYGFNNFETKKVVTAQSTIDSLQTVPVKKGVGKSVSLVTEGDLSFIAKKGAKDEEFVRTTQAIDESKIVAPIKKGDVLGTLTVTYNNKPQTVNMVAAEDVKKASWWRLLFRGIGSFFSDLFDSIKNLF